MTNTQDHGPSAAQAIARIIRGTGGPASAWPPSLGAKPDPTPGCDYGLVVGEQLKALTATVADIKTTVRWTFYAMAGAVLAMILDKVIGFIR
ncbi:MAG: hypothetical protein V2A79_19875 [Planctomycetota bacterium]